MHNGAPKVVAALHVVEHLTPRPTFRRALRPNGSTHCEAVLQFASVFGVTDVSEVERFGRHEEVKQAVIPAVSLRGKEQSPYGERQRLALSRGVRRARPQLLKLR